MRISDWSSDVCSSDLYTHVFYLPIEFPIVPDDLRPDDPDFQQEIDRRIVDLLEVYDVAYETLNGDIPPSVTAVLDRKSDVEGKSVSVRVDLGGRRIIKHKTQLIELINPKR